MEVLAKLISILLISVYPLIIITVGGIKNTETQNTPSN